MIPAVNIGARVNISMHQDHKDCLVSREDTAGWIGTKGSYYAGAMLWRNPRHYLLVLEPNSAFCSTGYSSVLNTGSSAHGVSPAAVFGLCYVVLPLVRIRPPAPKRPSIVQRDRQLYSARRRLEEEVVQPVGRCRTAVRQHRARGNSSLE